MTKLVAEIIAIGDEMVSGQRLDTNSKWLSQRLGEIGIEPSFHSCVGDNIADGVATFNTSLNRANIVLTTGGIGPTKDDLTRQVLANIAGVELEYHEEVTRHIQRLYDRYGRTMPENNKLQAYFPKGSIVINNEEGTAPGIHIHIGQTHFFSMPGVPYEMKIMWESYVQDAILRIANVDDSATQKIRHHVIHCFGTGESRTEELLKDLTARNRVPRVGITASQATISLRITAFGSTDEECARQIEDTQTIINQRIGNFVFGENGVQLENVVVDELAKKNLTLAMVDHGFGGYAGVLLHDADPKNTVVKHSSAVPISTESTLEEAAANICRQNQVDIGVAISAVSLHGESNGTGQYYEIAMAGLGRQKVKQMTYAGHSGLKANRTAKQILNEIRIFLTQQSD